MGRRAREARARTERAIRSDPIIGEERESLRRDAAYEGSPYHKRNPGDFGLTPPAAPRRDATLCDEAGITSLAQAAALFNRAIERGLASVSTGPGGFPKQLWVVDDAGRVFEAMLGGSANGRYHGYPIRRSDPLFDEVVRRWEAGVP